MRKIIAIAADYQHLRNFCKEKDIPLGRFVHATSIKKMKGLRGYRYIWISDPYELTFKQNLPQELRKAGAIRLPLDINQWVLTDFA